MTASTLTDFLLARIAEDEAEARGAIGMRDAIRFTHPPEIPDMALEAFEDIGVPAVIVGPERVLAECEAKRRIVERHEERIGMEYAVRCLALPYADHPDYREEWRP